LAFQAKDRGFKSRRPYFSYPAAMRNGSGWTAVGLDEVEPLPWQATELAWLPMREVLGTRIVGLAAFTADRVGQELIEGHTEDNGGRGHEEVYIVLRGRATFVLDGDELDAPVGTFVLVHDTAVHRRAVAAEPGSAVLALGGAAAPPGRRLPTCLRTSPSCVPRSSSTPTSARSSGTGSYLAAARSRFARLYSSYSRCASASASGS
jgi:hypothetical protein